MSLASVNPPAMYMRHAGTPTSDGGFGDDDVEPQAVVCTLGGLEAPGG
jgi:hypothetical protein